MCVPRVVCALVQLRVDGLLEVGWLLQALHLWIGGQFSSFKRMLSAHSQTPDA